MYGLHIRILNNLGNRSIKEEDTVPAKLCDCVDILSSVCLRKLLMIALVASYATHSAKKRDPELCTV